MGPYSREGWWRETKRRLPSEKKSLGAVLVGDSLVTDPDEVGQALLPFWNKVWASEPIREEELLKSLAATQGLAGPCPSVSTAVQGMGPSRKGCCDDAAA